MWVKIKKSYSGQLGIFMKDGRYDLPESKVAQLRKIPGYKNAFVETCAPWDDGKDEKAFAAANVRSEIDERLALSKQMSAEHAEFARQADEFVSPLAARQKVRADADRAAKTAKEKAEKKNASPKAIAEAWDSARAHEKADAEFELMLADMRRLIALGTLARLESEDAERKAKRLAKEAGIELPGDEPEKPAEPEPKEDADQPGGPAVSAGKSGE